MDAKFYCGLFEGDCLNGYKLGMGLTGGDFWPRVKGCRNLYRGGGTEDINFTSVIHTSDVDEMLLSICNAMEYLPLGKYLYVLRTANHCGNEESTSGASRLVEFDESGDYVGRQCNNILFLYANQVGSKVRLGWYYCPVDQEGSCTEFNVYRGNGADEIDYSSSVAVLPYMGKGFYSVCLYLSLVKECLFAVEAVSDKSVKRNIVNVQFQISQYLPENISTFDIKKI